MIHFKDSSSFALPEALLPTPPSSQSSNHDAILQDLFRARMDAAPRTVDSRRCTNERPRRASPLMVMSGPMLFERVPAGPRCSNGKNKSVGTSDWNDPNSLFHQLGQQKPLVNPGDSLNNAPFPLSSSLFPSSGGDNGIGLPRPTTTTTTTTTMTGDQDLDQRIRSFSASLMMSNNNRPVAVGGRRKRPRNQATRYRLVGQVLGQKGVQKMVSVVKEITQLQDQHANVPKESWAEPAEKLLRDNVLVDAWENTPLDDLKSLPWEEMLKEAMTSLDKYHAATNTSCTSDNES